MEAPTKHQTHEDQVIVKKDQAAIITTTTEAGDQLILVIPDNSSSLSHVLMAAVYDVMNTQPAFVQSMLGYFLENPDRAAIYSITPRIVEEGIAEKAAEGEDEVEETPLNS